MNHGGSLYDIYARCPIAARETLPHSLPKCNRRGNLISQSLLPETSPGWLTVNVYVVDMVIWYA